MCEASNNLGTVRAYTNVVVGVKNITIDHQNEEVGPNENITLIVEETSSDNKTVIGKMCNYCTG